MKLDKCKWNVPDILPPTIIKSRHKGAFRTVGPFPCPDIDDTEQLRSVRLKRGVRGPEIARVTSDLDSYAFGTVLAEPLCNVNTVLNTCGRSWLCSGQVGNRRLRFVVKCE